MPVQCPITHTSPNLSVSGFHFPTSCAVSLLCIRSSQDTRQKPRQTPWCVSLLFTSLPCSSYLSQALVSGAHVRSRSSLLMFSNHVEHLYVEHRVGDGSLFRRLPLGQPSHPFLTFVLLVRMNASVCDAREVSVARCDFS